MYARQRASDSETGWLRTRSQVTPERSTRLDARRYRSRSNSSISRGFAVTPRKDDRTSPGRAIRVPSPSGYDRQIAAPLVQPFRTLHGHDDLVLDPDPDAPFQVDPGLVREGHARLERCRVALHDVGGLVDLESDPVSGPVDEPVPVARLG